MISQPLSKETVTVSGKVYRITGPMIISGNLRPIAGIQVQLFSHEMHETTELTVEEYLHRLFELGADDRGRVFQTIKVRWDGDDKPTSWASWRYRIHGNYLEIYIGGPCGNYATISGERV